MSKLNAAKNVSNNVPSKMERAMSIYQTNLGNESHRKVCINAFIEQLDMKKVTANTYYSLCGDRIDAEVELANQQILSGKNKRVYSAVKVQRGSDVASRVALFTKRTAAVEFNELHGYNAVIPGVAEVGQPVNVKVKDAA